MDSTETPVKPFLRWAGSKRKLLPHLAAQWDRSYGRYIEPFAGSACLFFQIRPEAAVLGDSNRELVGVYRAIRDRPERIHRRLVAIPRDEDSYYRWRDYDPKGMDAETRALRFLYLNRNCFNGIYRTNEAGQFNVPFGRKIGGYLTREELVSCSRALQSVKFVADDFEVTLSHVRRGDFVYLDPPFAVTARRVFCEYGKVPFGTDDVPRLASELRRIDRVGGAFLVSYADCREARSLAQEWRAKKLLVRRHIAGFVDHRGHAYEWLISNRNFTSGGRAGVDPDH